VSDEDRKSSWKWLQDNRYLGTILLDFRPGWDNLHHLEEEVDRQEFEERLARCPSSTHKAARSAVQSVIPDAGS
jgi:hypothetical protein